MDKNLIKLKVISIATNWIKIFTTIILFGFIILYLMAIKEDIKDVKTDTGRTRTRILKICPTKK